VTSPSLQRAWLLMGPGWSAPSGLDPTGAVQANGKAFANRNHVRFERLGQLVSEPRKFLRARLLRARSGDCHGVSVRTSPAHAALHEADLLIEEQHFSGALNRVDYAAFYVARAVLAIRDLDSSRHSGVIACSRNISFCARAIRAITGQCRFRRRLAWLAVPTRHRLCPVTESACH
jgi:hypothetical protein